MLSRGPLQLQHFTIIQLLISVLMPFIYKENATDTPWVGSPVVFPAVLMNLQCSIPVPASSPLLFSVLMQEGLPHGLRCPLEFLGGHFPIATTGLGGLGLKSNFRNKLAGWLQARLGFSEPYPPNRINHSLWECTLGCFSGRSQRSMKQPHCGG